MPSMLGKGTPSSYSRATAAHSRSCKKYMTYFVANSIPPNFKASDTSKLSFSIIIATPTVAVVLKMRHTRPLTALLAMLSLAWLLLLLVL